MFKRLGAREMWDVFRSIPAFRGISAISFNKHALHDVGFRMYGHYPYCGNPQSFSQMPLMVWGDLHEICGLTCEVCGEQDIPKKWDDWYHTNLYGRNRSNSRELPGVHICWQCANMCRGNKEWVLQCRDAYHQDFFASCIALAMLNKPKMEKVLGAKRERRLP